jgi:hypothetical protein
VEAVREFEQRRPASMAQSLPTRKQAAKARTAVEMFGHVPPLQFDAARLGPEDVNILVDALGAASEWLADTACTLLMPAGDPAIGQRAEARIPQIPPNRRQHAVIVAVANNSSPPDAAMRLFGGSRSQDSRQRRRQRLGSSTHPRPS